VSVQIYPNCDEIVAHLPGVIGAVHDTAQDGARRAEAVLRAHFYRGQSEIEVTRGAVDSFVSLIDPAALSIEYGRTGARGRGASQGVHALEAAFG
jgi:hypothetical protein